MYMQSEENYVPDTELEDLKTSELLEIYNDLRARTSNDKPLRIWKKARSYLIDQICDLRDAVERDMDEGEASDVADAVLQHDEKKEDEKSGDKPPIWKTAVDLLCTVVGYINLDTKQPAAEGDEGAYSVGLTYAEIIDHIRAMYPGSKTSVACLRWYAVKIRAEEFGFEGRTLPQYRQRSSVRPTD